MIKCKFENNNQALLRHAVVDGIIVENNKILLVKRATHLSNPGKYALPGGFVNRDETVYQAIIREVLEETGYQSEVINLLSIIDNPNRAGEDRQNISFVFLLKPIKKISSSDDEVSEVIWFDINKLPNQSEFAFDHYQIIGLYKKYLREKFPLPRF